jgi:hypothetical protein
MRPMRFVLAAAAVLALSGCVVAPAPYYNSYPAYGYGYGPGYVASPTVVIGGGGWGRGYRHHRW